MTGSLMRLVGKMSSTWRLGMAAAGDGRDDRNFCAFGHSGLGAFFKTNVFPVYEHVDEAANLAVFIANAFFHSRVALFEVGEDLVYGFSGDVHNRLLFSEFSQRCGDADFGWHLKPPTACRRLRGT